MTIHGLVLIEFSDGRLNVLDERVGFRRLHKMQRKLPVNSKGLVWVDSSEGWCCIVGQEPHSTGLQEAFSNRGLKLFHKSSVNKDGLVLLEYPDGSVVRLVILDGLLEL